MSRNQTGRATVIDKLSAQPERRTQNRREIVYAHIDGCRPLEFVLVIRQRPAGKNGNHIHIRAGKASEQLFAWVQQMLRQLRLELDQPSLFSEYLPTSRLNWVTRVVTRLHKNRPFVCSRHVSSSPSIHLRVQN